MMSITGGQIVARTLRELSATTIFSVSGNQILPVYDAAADFGIRIIHTRHESAAAYAAAALADLSGTPGVVLVSAGPGCLAALTGVSTAKVMELPLLLLSGSSPTTNAGFGNFQEFDLRSSVRPCCKESLEATSIDNITEILCQAWNLAQTDVPGPVHVSLPANVLRGAVAKDAIYEPPPSASVQLSASAEATLQAMAERLQAAERPLIIARPSANRGPAGTWLWMLAKNLGIQPVISESPRGLNDPKYSHLAPRYKDSDCGFVVSPSDFSVGFLGEGMIASKGIILHLDYPGDPKRRRDAHLHIQAPTAPALEYLATATADHVRDDAWSEIWSFPEPDFSDLQSSRERLHPLQVARHVRDFLRPDDVLVLDGGEFCQWMRLGFRDLPNRMLWNSKFGGIGGAIPMALGAAVRERPGRTLAFLGDGCAGYHCSEFETAARIGAAFVAIVGNDARWGAEWHMQATRYGVERTFSTDLLPARYDQVASGLRAMGFHIEDTDSLMRGLAEGLNSKQPVCLNVQIDSVRSPAVAE